MRVDKKHLEVVRGKVTNLYFENGRKGIFKNHKSNYPDFHIELNGNRDFIIPNDIFKKYSHIFEAENGEKPTITMNDNIHIHLFNRPFFLIGFKYKENVFMITKNGQQILPIEAVRSQLRSDWWMTIPLLIVFIILYIYYYPQLHIKS